jgi:type IV pilus assembly protein PilY1
MKKIGLVIVFFILLFPGFHVYGLDTDLYTVSSLDVPPNVLIMFDNSASMNETISGEYYDKTILYPYVITDVPERVYYRVMGGAWNIYRNSVDGTPPDYIDGVNCPEVKTALKDYGFYNGKIKFSSSECGTSNTVSLATGNYLNYLQLTGGPADKPKLGLAKGIIQSYINTTDGVRFGAMIFNDNEGGRLLREVKDMTPTNRSDLHSAIGGLSATTWTPLAETLYESGCYFRGAKSYFNKDASGNPIQYTSPLQVWCQKSYVIVITDGESTKDRNSILSTDVGDTNGDGYEPGGSHEVPYEDEGSDYLDDVAKKLHENDLNLDMKDKQNIVTYTIGFTVNSPLLERAAQYGGGRYFYCHNAQSFIAAMQSIIEEILSKSTSYVAPVVPISQMEKTSAGDRMYIAMFKPTMKSFWEGNIKKYGIATEKNGSIEIGDILDANGDPVMDSESRIREDALSYWSSKPDGEYVRKGGVGEVLQNRTTPRNIYTYLGTSPDLTHSSNAFNYEYRENIDPALLGLPSPDTDGRDKLINFIHGLDSYDENGNLITNEKRDWILGAFIHSRPLVIHYGTTRTVIYAGANDGMLHAFDDTTGEELWAFIPPSLLPNLRNLDGATIEFFVDGAPKVYIGTDKTVLLFGLRRGGDRYIALDITDPLSPKFLWEIGPSTTGFGELGETWSTPQIGKIQLGTEEKWVAFIGGGYDVNQDKLPVSSKDSRGRAVYVIDILTGDLIWSYSYANGAYVNDTTMEYCIPSDVTRVDTDGNGKIDRLYVGDVGGRIWRFDIGDLKVSSWTGRIIFSSNAGTSDQRKIFYPPDITLEKDNGYYEMVFFGTGDREHPKTTNVENRLYAIKDKNQSTVLSENDLVNVTDDLLQDSDTTLEEKTGILQSLQEESGWYIRLGEHPGEKCLSNPVVFYGIIYYTTFTPTFGAEDDICFVGEGTSRLYALNYKTGNAVFNLDGSLDGTMTRSDRSMVIGSAIPSGVIITFISGKSMGYVGVGGGVYKPTLLNYKTIIPVSWRIVF